VVSDLDGQRAIHKGLKTKHDLHFTNEQGATFSPLQLLAKRCESNGNPCEATMEQIKEAAEKLEKSCDRRSECEEAHRDQGSKI